MNKLLLKEIREDFKFSQQEMADKLGVSRSYYSKLENGKAELNDIVRAKADRLYKELLSLREEQKAHYEAQKEKHKQYLAVQNEKKELIKNIEKVRKAQDFNIQLEPSVDMVWLTKLLKNDNEGLEFENWICNLIRLNGQVVEKPYGGDGVKTGRKIWTIYCPDGVIHVEYKFYVQGKIVPILKVQFNPNKVTWENKYLIGLMKFLGDNPLTRKFDVCKDFVGVSTAHVLDFDNRGKEVKTIQPNTPDGGVTYYVGDMNNNGVRLYDKKAELKQKDNKEITFECSRIETRVKLQKGLPLDEVIGCKVATKFPIFTAINQDMSMIDMEDKDFDMTTYCQVLAVLDKKVNINRLTRTYRTKVRDFLRNMVTDTITLTAVDVQVAMLKFQQAYSFNYAIHHGDISQEMELM